MPEHKHKKRTTEEINEMILQYKQGKTLREVGLDNELTHERVRQLFKKVGYTAALNTQDRNSSRIKQKERNEKLKAKFSEPELRRLYVEEKKTAKEISKITGHPYNQVIRAMRLHELPIRSRSEVALLSPARFPEMTRENLFKLYIKENKSMQEVADLCGCAKITLAKKLAKFGIGKLRPRAR